MLTVTPGAGLKSPLVHAHPGGIGLPPSAVKTYRDLVCYEWAKTIAQSSGMKDNWAFIMDRMRRLKEGGLTMSEIVREDRLLAVEGFRECAYCGGSADLTWDHLIPTSRGGPDTISNQVPACRPCNSSKGGRDVLEWYRSRRDVHVPRLVWGKYLKLMAEVWTAQGLLDRALPVEERGRWSGLRVE